MLILTELVFFPLGSWAEYLHDSAMKMLKTALLSLLLVGCGGFTGNAPPLRGTVSGDNAEAATLFATAQSLEAGGERKKAMKNYQRLVQKFPADKRVAESRFRRASLLNTKSGQREAFNAYQVFIDRHPGDRLYAQAVAQQEAVAHAAATGDIRTNFLGLKSRLERRTIVGMLEQVRDNAPRANSAPKAQYLIGQVNESRKQPAEAIAAYEKLIDDYPKTNVAPDAQFRIGEILLKQAKDGNQDQANLGRAKDAYGDLLLAYPNSSFSEQAKQRLASIGSRSLKASYDVAEFYRKKGEAASAIYYYQEVVDGSAESALRNQAAARLAQLKR